MKILVAVKRVIDYNVQIRVKEDGSGVHTDTFNIDEGALEVSAGLMAWLTYSELIKG